MDVLGIEIGDSVYRCINADVFSTNNEFKANVVIEHNFGNDFDLCFDTFTGAKATVHGIHLGHSIKLDVEDVEADYGNDGIVRLYLSSETLPRYSKGTKDFFEKLRLADEEPRLFGRTIVSNEPMVKEIEIEENNKNVSMASVNATLFMLNRFMERDYKSKQTTGKSLQKVEYREVILTAISALELIYDNIKNGEK